MRNKCFLLFSTQHSPVVRDAGCSGETNLLLFDTSSFNALNWEKIRNLRDFFIVTTVRFVQSGGLWSNTGVHLVMAPPSTEGHLCDLSLSSRQLLVSFVLPEALGEIRIQVSGFACEWKSQQIKVLIEFLRCNKLPHTSWPLVPVCVLTSLQLVR